jgi:hypothetical protein
MRLSYTPWGGIIKPPFGTAQLNPVHPWAENLVLAALFNEGVGDRVNDYSIQGNNGVFNSLSLPTWVSGKYGSALNFDSDSIGCGDNPSLHPVNLSVFSPIYPTASGYGQIVCADHDESTERNFHFRLENSTPPKLQFIYWVGNAVKSATSTMDVSLNEWHEVGVTWDGSVTRFYLDGVEEEIDSDDGDIDQDSAELQIGGRSRTKGETSLVERFAGDIALVYMWAEAKSTAFMLDINNNIYAPFQQKMLWDWFRLPGAEAIMNQLQYANIGADLFNGTLL